MSSQRSPLCFVSDILWLYLDTSFMMKDQTETNTWEKEFKKGVPAFVTWKVAAEGGGKCVASCIAWKVPKHRELAHSWIVSWAF